MSTASRSSQEEDLITTRQAADLMGVTRQSMFNFRREGAIDFLVINKRTFLYKIDDVLNLLRAREPQIRQRQSALEGSGEKGE